MSDGDIVDFEEEISASEIDNNPGLQLLFKEDSTTSDDCIEYNENEDLEETYLDENYLIEEEEFEVKETNEVEEEKQDNDEPEMYHCSACDVDFVSVRDHINKFHNKHDVLVEVEKDFDKDTEVQIKTETVKEENMEEDILDEFMVNEDGTYYVTESTELLEEESIAEGLFKCGKCPASFAMSKGLSAHMKVHKEHGVKTNVTKVKQPKKRDKLIPDAEFLCTICNTMFTSQKSLKLHSRMHNPVKNKTLEQAAKHELSTCKKTNKTFYCAICEKDYDVAYEDMHMQTHNNEVVHSCSTCNKKFSSEANLNMHLKAHHDEPMTQSKSQNRNIALPYPCQYCGKEFSRPHEKVKHERIHTGEKPHRCEICGKCFRVSYCLTLHMRTHTDARPYVCPHCNKRYKAHSVYNHHLMTHSDVRAYQCPFCPKAFKTSVQLAGHKNSHTKPFVCTVCNRPFATLYAVKGHMESHQRPNHSLKHACHICGATYARGFALKDHIKDHHSASLDLFETGDIDKALEDGIMDEETRMAGQSILPDIIDEDKGTEEEIITISGIDHFANEEVVTDWMK